MIATVLVDCDDEAAELVRALLARERDLAVVGRSPQEGSLAAVVRRSRPDVLLVWGPAPDAALRIEQAWRETALPIVAVAPGPRGSADRRGLLAAGAWDVVEALDRPAPLSRAVRAASARPRGPVPPRPARLEQEEGAVVAMGASTGGPPVLARILEQLPGDFPAPVLVVQHMTDDFMDQFASWLATTTPLPVQVAQHGERLAEGRVYVGPPGRHLALADRSTIELLDSPPVQGLRPSADVLFSSLARCRGRRRVGVILSGMGADGADGLRLLRDSGGYSLAQDEASCAVYGMPRAAVERRAVDEVLRPEQIARRLQALVGEAWR